MTAIMVAGIGGHLSQLVQLSDRLAGLGDDALWVTTDSPQSRSLLADRRTQFIPAITERDFKGVLRGTGDAARIFRATEPTAVVSTGPSIALSFLPQAILRKIPAFYIESAARVGAPSLTGRVLEWIPGVRLFRQYAEATTGRWKYAGSVFDGFEAAPPRHADVRRVVVTVGSGAHGFRRLIERLVKIIPPEIEVLWQTGSTPVDDLPIKAQPIVPAFVLERAIEEADAIIAHAGCGSALSALNAGKSPLLIPREPQFGELVDRHQVQLARLLAGRGLAIHRTPETVAFSDVLEAARCRVERLARPPTFELS